jgi:hypothetical protein
VPSENWQETITGCKLELLSSEMPLLLETSASKEELLNDELELGYKLGL